MRVEAEHSSRDPIEVVSYDPGWALRFAQLGTQLRATLGWLALRIDHIGSTSVVGLAAEPSIDIRSPLRH